MLWFIAILATLNLCVGYALGAQFGWSLVGLEGLALSKISLPGLSLLKRKKPEEQPDEGEAVPAEETTSVAEPEPSVAIETTPSESDIADLVASDEAPPEKPSTAEVLEGLAAFQAQLTSLGEALNAADEDDAFDDCAGRVQQANHEYLDHANDAIKQLEENEEAAPVRDAVREGAEEAQRVSDEFDAAMDDEAKDDAVREKIRGLTAKLVENAKSTETRVRKAAPKNTDDEPAEDPLAGLPPLQIDPATSLATLDSLTARIESLIADTEGKPPVIVAAVQADGEGDTPLPAEALPALLPKLGEAVAEVTGPIGPPAMFNGDQLLMVLPGDSVDDASRRVEQIRLQVEATKFVYGDEERSVTVSCGVAQSGPDATLDQLQELLGEALSEAHRYGGNRACHHDGKFPAPVMPEDFEPTPRTVNL